MGSEVGLQGLCYGLIGRSKDGQLDWEGKSAWLEKFPGWVRGWKMGRGEGNGNGRGMVGLPGPHLTPLLTCTGA